IYGPPSMHLDKLLTEQEAIVQEDIDLVESVQRNYESSRYSPGPVHPLEMRILHQQKLFLRHLLSGGKSQKPDSP
ncbi:MAG: hypothetical protein NZL92_12375, partial [Gloeomargarita sp. SKYG116]|nr:hypothetical protein [Gloeomargarita sp. SKYG116]MDW8402475.1 hypothetical protein [Gloeomargarita sp. SKYGB_i_bin116]